jgi:hypothetical protein
MTLLCCLVATFTYGAPVPAELIEQGQTFGNLLSRSAAKKSRGKTELVQHMCKHLASESTSCGFAGRDNRLRGLVDFWYWFLWLHAAM